MTDAFTQAVVREVAQLMAQNTQQTTSFAPEAETTDFQLNPQQVLEVMQGNSQWLNQFEKELENSFQRVADKALDYWLKNTDKEIRDSLKALSRVAEILLEDSLSAHSNVRGEAKLQSSLASLSGKATKELLDSFFSNERITTQESERSRQTSQRYKHSRGQAQAQLSKELGRGKRYT